MIQKSIANYTQEQTLFRQLVESDTEPNILLFQGESGSGKSYLISHCLNTIPDTPSVLMKCQSGDVSISALFTIIGNRFGWDQLPNFTHIVATFQEQSDKVNDPMWQMGMREHLSEIEKISDIESRISRYNLLTNALLIDIKQLGKPFVLAIDAYEKTPTLFNRWFAQKFLVGVTQINQMRVLVGGQTVPELREEWSFCAQFKELTGIDKENEWLAWAESIGRSAPSREAMEWVIKSLKGNPSQIVEVIKTQFPENGIPTELKEEIDHVPRRLVRKNLITSFSISELKDVCFDLNKNYEDFPNHNQISGFARELLVDAERNNYFPQLLEILQEERPDLDW